MTDFKKIAQAALNRAGEFLTQWLPGGHIVGKEYVCGNLKGGPGDSFKCNIETGKWADFATDECGGDLISLYARIENIKQGEAATRLADRLGMRQQKIDHNIVRPPVGVSAPEMNHIRYGPPVGSWAYRDMDGVLFFVARYETSD